MTGGSGIAKSDTMISGWEDFTQVRNMDFSECGIQSCCITIWNAAIITVGKCIDRRIIGSYMKIDGKLVLKKRVAACIIQKTSFVIFRSKADHRV